MQSDRIIRCKYVRCNEDMIMNGPEVRAAVCNGIEYTNEKTAEDIIKGTAEDAYYLFQEKVRLVFDKRKIPGMLKIYADGKALLEESERQDIIFYLIKDSLEDELELVAELKEKHKNCKIIFAAEDGSYLKEAYKAQPFRYLYLSDPEEEIQEAMINAIKEKREKQYITLEGDGKYYYILLKNVLYIEALGDEIGIFTMDGYEYILRMPLKHIFLLIEDEFIRCNRQQIVNARHIRRLEKEGATLVNNQEVVISGRERKNAAERYAEYVFRMKL